MVAKLEELGTDQLAISDIKELPIEGLSGLSHMQLNGLISGYKVPHAGSKLDKLRQIDTAQYTAEELHEMTDPESNFRGFRDILYLNKIPFKPSEKVLKSSLEIFKRMGKIDTSRHTLEELYGMSGSQGTMSEFRRTIQKYKVRYKNEILEKATIDEIRGAATELRKAGFVVSVVSISEHLQASRTSIWQQLKDAKEHALLDYVRNERGSGTETIVRIKEAVRELKASGTKTTITSVAKYLGISKQRVQVVLQQAGELSILDSFRNRDEIERIANAVKHLKPRAYTYQTSKACHKRDC